MKFLAAVMLFNIFIIARGEDSDACSTVDSNTRVDCGFYGINSTGCAQKDCCWDDSVENVPYCFNKPNTAAPDYEACSSRDPYQRAECGFYGINQTVCNGKGCCYDNTVGGGVPWCFNKPDIDSPDYEACSARDPSLRVECGSYGIDKPHCNEKGCCYDNSVGGGVPWCFNKPATSSPDYDLVHPNMKFLAAVMLFNIFIIARGEDSDACSTVDSNTRVDCGFYGINSTGCAQKDCCWDDSVENVPYCFNKPNTAAPDYEACSSRDPYQRAECGFYGINQTVCNGKGCCYDNTVGGGVPWCFNKPDIDSPDYEACSARDPSLRVECGSYGIDKPHCNEKGCCYDNSVGGGVPWCFNKPATSSPDYEICMSVDHSRRVECGWFSITEQQCVNRRCCYDDSTNGATYCFNKPDTNSPDYEICSKVDPNQRVDCGWFGVTRDQCQAKGCCYDNTLNGLAWCFNKPDVSTPEECSSVEPADRIDCGYFGIDKEECDERGCCYDNTVRDSPCCFHKATADEDIVSADDPTTDSDACSTVDSITRVDCGFYGINSTSCIQKGCCWDDSVENVPYCFNKPNTAAPDYEACSSREPNQRAECGFYGISQTVCNGRGCCYDNTVGGGVPWCFNKPDINSTDYKACSSRDPILRVDCGFYGINKTTCQGKGCCYDNSVGGGVPWCFNKPDTSSPDYDICSSVDHSRRVECGWIGITEQQCVGRRCCYDDSTNGAKYCFNKPNTSSPDYETCSEVDPYQRVDCGWFGITRDQCQAKGCCYDNTLNGLAWCFNKPDVSTPAECNTVEPRDREECGYFGINRLECVSRGCCYDNTVRDYPWCFHKPAA